MSEQQQTLIPDLFGYSRVETKHNREPFTTEGTFRPLGSTKEHRTDTEIFRVQGNTPVPITVHVYEDPQYPRAHKRPRIAEEDKPPKITNYEDMVGLDTVFPDFRCPVCNLNLKGIPGYVHPKCMGAGLPLNNKVKHLTEVQITFLRICHFNKWQQGQIEIRESKGKPAFLYGRTTNNINDIEDIFEEMLPTGQPTTSQLSISMYNIAEEIQLIATNAGEKTWTRKFLSMLSGKLRQNAELVKNSKA